MRFLDTLTITLAGLMVGNEPAVSAFFNPAVWQLEDLPQARGLAILARRLGGFMPGWYTLCLALLVLESVLRRHQLAFMPLLTATLIWVGVIALTLAALVPLNNRVADLDIAAPMPGWKQIHKRWDSLHRLRILLLTAAVFLLTWALVA